LSTLFLLAHATSANPPQPSVPSSSKAQGENTYVPGPSLFKTPAGRVFNSQYRPLGQHSTNNTVR